MNINYNDYPSLLFLSFDKDSLPDELPFEANSQLALKYLEASDEFHELFSYIAACNTIEKANTTTNYLIENNLFNRIDSNFPFRNENFQYFINNHIKKRHGTILFRDGGQYVYFFLNTQETKKVKNKDGRYICTALLKNNIFVGFEEAILTKNGLEMYGKGYYEFSVDTGGYLSFVIVTLAYAEKQENLQLYESEKVSEKIFLLK